MPNLEYSESMAESNRRITLPSVHKCKKCKYWSRSLFFIRNHVRRHRTPLRFFDCEQNDLEAYFCGDCNLTTHQYRFFIRHIQNSHDNILEDKEYRCQSCHFQSYSLLVWLGHTAQCTDHDLQNLRQFQCPYCQYRSMKKPLLRSHIYFRHLDEDRINWFRCDLCQYRAKKRGSLLMHVQRRHLDGIKFKWFLCDQCTFVAKSEKSLQLHIQTKHRVLKKQKNTGWFKCAQCVYTTPIRVNLQRHTLVKHTPDDTVEWFHCDHCPYKSKAKHLLRKHASRTHRSGDKLTDQREATSKIKTEGHVKRVKCVHCAYQTTIKANLRRHIVCKHTPDDKIEWFYCGHCPHKTKVNYLLQKHIFRKHRSDNEIKTEDIQGHPDQVKTNCESGSFGAKTKDIRKMHKSWYKCALCAYQTPLKSNLKRHILSSKHRSDHQQPNTDGTHLSGVKTEGFNCARCGFQCQTKENLRKHMVFNHTQHECSYCSYKTTNKLLLFRHIKRSHLNKMNT